MSKVYHLTFPLKEEDVRQLQMGDIVYLNGTILTMRDMGHARALEMIARGEKLPFDLAGSAIWHAAPIVKQDDFGKWHILSAGSTTSSRFTPLGSDIIRLTKMRVTLGKGTMFQKAVDTMQEIGSVYLNTTGGCAAYYAQCIEEVEDVYWLDLGLPEASWIMRVKDFGPLIVGIDAHGRSLYEEKKKIMIKNLKKVGEEKDISFTRDYTYMPLTILGRPRDYM